jgi:hypothetical protein
MSITTITIVLTRVSINNSPFQDPDTIEMDLSEDTISWEASSTITIGNHFLLLEASDVVFAPYTYFIRLILAKVLIYTRIFIFAEISVCQVTCEISIYRGLTRYQNVGKLFIICY